MSNNKKHSKQDIIDVGVALFWKQGYNATGLSDIIEAAHIPKGTFYNFFANKIDFAVQAVDRYSTEAITQHVRPYLTDATIASPKQRILNFYAHMADVYGGRGCLWIQMTNELGGIDATLDAMLVQKKSEIIALLTDAITAGVAAGEIASISLQPSQRASLLVAQFDGILSQAKIGRATPLMGDFLISVAQQLA